MPRLSRPLKGVGREIAPSPFPACQPHPTTPALPEACVPVPSRRWKLDGVSGVCKDAGAKGRTCEHLKGQEGVSEKYQLSLQ